jgi:hypothetical protein
MGFRCAKSDSYTSRQEFPVPLRNTHSDQPCQNGRQNIANIHRNTAKKIRSKFYKEGPKNIEKKFSVKRPTKYPENSPQGVRQNIHAVVRPRNIQIIDGETADNVSRLFIMQHPKKISKLFSVRHLKNIAKFYHETPEKISRSFTMRRPKKCRAILPRDAQKISRNFTVIHHTV